MLAKDGSLLLFGRVIGRQRDDADSFGGDRLDRKVDRLESNALLGLTNAFVDDFKSLKYA